MTYQPLDISSEFLQIMKAKPLNIEELYKLINANNVERICLDRLSMIINDISNNYTNPSVLDLGCSGGFFCIGLANTVAKEVTGVDDDRYIKVQGESSRSSVIETAKRIRDLGLINITIVNDSIENFIRNNYEVKKYDVILCLNILHHFYKGYGNLSDEGKLDYNNYITLIKRLGNMTNQVMYFETNAAYFENYEKALLEIMHYGGFTNLCYLGCSPAADGELRILWKFQK